jgi:hypothetical protein
MELTQVQRAILTSGVKTELVQLIFGIMKDEAFSFNKNLLLAKKQEDILQAHALASAGAEFHDRVINRIENEIQQYTNSPRSNDLPQDFTEGMLDTGGEYDRGI